MGWFVIFTEDNGLPSCCRHTRGLRRVSILRTNEPESSPLREGRHEGYPFFPVLILAHFPLAIFLPPELQDDTLNTPRWEWTDRPDVFQSTV